jgi:hypothetical protein
VYSGVEEVNDMGQGERKTTKGTKLFGVEIDVDLLEQFSAFCEERGETKRKHVEWALKRHMRTPPPPPPEPPPLPPVTAEDQPAAPPAPAKTATKGKAKERKAK